jgi:hypothetical protein
MRDDAGKEITTGHELCTCGHELSEHTNPYLFDGSNECSYEDCDCNGFSPEEPDFDTHAD